MSGPSSAASVRPLGVPGRIAVIGIVIAGALVAISSGFGFLFVPYGAVGGYLVIRRPRMSIGWILIGIAWEFALLTAPVDATVQQFADGSVPLPVALFAVAEGGSGALAFYLFAVLAIVFPTGRFAAGPWGTVSRLAFGAGLLIVAAAYVAPVISVGLAGLRDNVVVRNPLGVLPDLGIWQLFSMNGTSPPIMFFSILFLLLAAAISLVVRARRATGIERQQLRWFSASIAFVVAGVAGGLAMASIVPGLGESGVAWIPGLVAFALVPVAVAIAVLRYRLYEIDRIISRTLSWAMVTGVLIVTFAGGVIALQAVLEGFTQGETLAVAASTLVVFALFHPVRSRIQRVVDRRFDRARYDGQKVVDAFARQLRDEVDLDRLRIALVATADDVVRPVSTWVWLRSGEAGR